MYTFQITKRHTTALLHLFTDVYVYTLPALDEGDTVFYNGHMVKMTGLD